jgi:glycosyltransferase involved in cell wall biosynthesis
MQENDIKIYHLLTYGNALWPASAYGQKQFFIWGPTSAGSSVSKEFSKNYAFKNRSKEFLQRIMAKSLRFNIGFLGRCRDAKLILCKTEQTKVSIPEKYRHKAVVFTDVAVDLLDASKYIKEHKDGLIRYLAVGRLEAWRGFDLLIEAFAKVLKHNENVHLDILGNGSDMARLKALAEKLKLDAHIKFRGNVPLEEYYQFMANCDVVVNPALKEGAVTTAFDSLSFAKPLVCINSGGYTRYFENTYSIVLELTDRASLVENISDAIKRLTNRALRDGMSEEIIRVRNNFTWEEKGLKIRNLILEKV